MALSLEGAEEEEEASPPLPARSSPAPSRNGAGTISTPRDSSCSRSGSAAATAASTCACVPKTITGRANPRRLASLRRAPVESLSRSAPRSASLCNRAICFSRAAQSRENRKANSPTAPRSTASEVAASASAIPPVSPFRARRKAPRTWVAAMAAPTEADPAKNPKSTSRTVRKGASTSERMRTSMSPGDPGGGGAPPPPPPPREGAAPAGARARRPRRRRRRGKSRGRGVAGVVECRAIACGCCCSLRGAGCCDPRAFAQAGTKEAHERIGADAIIGARWREREREREREERETEQEAERAKKQALDGCSKKSESEKKESLSEALSSPSITTRLKQVSRFQLPSSSSASGRLLTLRTTRARSKVCQGLARSAHGRTMRAARRGG